MNTSCCGVPIPPGARFCPQCGAPVPASPAPPGVRSRPAGVVILAVLDFLGAAFFLLLTLVALVFLVSPGMAEARVALAFVIAVLLLLALLHAACGIGLLALRGWGRILQIVLACLALLNIPLGTIVGVLVLVFLLQPGARVLFSGRPAGEWKPEEVLEARKLHGAGYTVSMAAIVAVLLLAVPCSGIIAAIAIPNFVNAVERGKQKRTIADVRTVGTAVEAYAVDHGEFPDAASIQELGGLVEPTYVTTLPRTDGWGNPIQYVRLVPEEYVVRSAGKDGAWEGEPETYVPGTTTGFESDIVFRTGTFIRYPEGTEP